MSTVYNAKVIIAADHGGYKLKEQLVEKLLGLGLEVVDMGCKADETVDYPDYAEALANRLAQGEASRGILICGTGIGMSIAANKCPGIRAALCHDTFSARATREHNDSNVLCLGARVIGAGLAWDIVLAWLQTAFVGGRHQRRIDKITAMERKCQLGSGTDQ